MAYRPHIHLTAFSSSGSMEQRIGLWRKGRGEDSSFLEKFMFVLS
jgi:hypothetical protein